ncbi:MAG: VacJ family lipoprotein [Xanthomonadales bacterium]|nr:VacJ family lipoprotein [Xanthomonadales bacterium]
MTRPGLLLSLILLPSLALAQGGPVAAPDEFDPWERGNRKVFAFNEGVDRYLIRPVARGYVTVTPSGVRQIVGNFFGNLRLPWSATNSLLQGKPGDSGRNLSRFVVNSTVGLLGLFDPASKFGIYEQQEDFGQTLAVWGVGQGPYLVLPFVGPSSVRDGVGGGLDGYVSATTYYARTEANYWPQALELINLRAQLFQIESYVADAYDPYVFMRDAYRQRRIHAIHDGDPPPELLEQLLMPEDDPADLLEDDW